MKKLIAGTAALVALALPQTALSRYTISPGSTAPVSSQAQPTTATPNFNATGTGTASSCGSNCTILAGRYTGNQLSGTFSGQLTRDPSLSGCTALHGVLSLDSSQGAVETGFSGAACGTGAATRITGSYSVTDGTGAYQESGVGWGDFSVTVAPGTFTFTAHGMFFPTLARTTGL
jgi:hypothetical protein